MNETRRKEEEETEREQKAFSAIDWHDFIIADTIEFGAHDKMVDLPKPYDLQTFAAMSVVQRQELWGGRVLVPKSVQIEEEMEIDEPTIPVPKRPTPTPVPVQIVTASGHQDTINVRYDYVPKGFINKLFTMF